MRFSLGVFALGLLLFSASTNARSLTLSSASAECQECLASVHYLEDLLKDPAFTEYLVNHISKDVCTELPIAGDKCKNLAEGLVPVIMQWFQASSTPLELCSAAGACSLVAQASTLKINKPLHRVGDSGECAICKFVVGEIKVLISDTETMKNVNEAAHATCASLPKDIADICHTMWDTYEPMFISFINTASPDDLCALSGLCWDSLLARTTAVRAAVSPVPALAPALRAVGQARLVAQSRAVGIQVGNACDTCRMAVIQAHMLIASPDVQASMVNYTKTMCEGFEAFADTCKMYVDQYSPLVFSLLQQYLSPDTLCTDIGMCPPPSKPMALVSQVLQHAKRAMGVHNQAQHIVHQHLHSE